MLRRFPVDVYKPFEDGGNTFSTSIHVLVSAVQKIARVTKMTKGLLLYRGLGATELPAHFFQPDATTGCRGFAEWGFMSTTSNKAVATQDSGIKQGKPLAMLFEIQVSSVDRGACIRDFSQFPDEIEYLWVPCSFLEPWGSPYLEVTPFGVLSIVRVRVNANLKAPTVEDLVELKKQIHLASFKYVPEEIRHELEQRALGDDATSRWTNDAARLYPESGTLLEFVVGIVEECRGVYSRHERMSADRYVDSELYRRLVIEMLEVRTMAISKFDFWMEDMSQVVMLQRSEPMRLAHRRYVAFLERALAKMPESGPQGEKREAALKLCRIKGLLQGGLEDRNDLGENRIISAAAEGRDSRDLRLLALAGADVDSVTEDQRQDTPCIAAAMAGHASTLTALHELGADISKRNSSGDSPLIGAALEGQESCVRVLLELSAEVEARDHNGCTALHVAAQRGHVGCAAALLERGADVNARTGDIEMTPLHAAVVQGMLECVKLLAEGRADVEAQTTTGCTAAHFAAQQGHVDCLLALRALGANMWVKDNCQLSLVHYASSDECLAALPAEVLKQHKKNSEAFRKRMSLQPNEFSSLVDSVIGEVFLPEQAAEETWTPEVAAGQSWEESACSVIL